MLTKNLSRKLHRAALAGPILAAILAGCAAPLPSTGQSNPADPRAPAAATAPSRPTLLATSHSFTSAAADDREQKAKQMKMTTKPYYTCVMHPQIHEDKPGQCPICGMTLVKKPAAPEGAKP